MTVVYILAHFDDEYCALPLVRAGVRAGLDQRFLYVADYAQAAVARRRLEETRRALAHHGVDPAHAIHVGAGTGAIDGEVHRRLPAVLDAIRAAVAGLGVERIVAPAWEGGHMDHDGCAALAARLAADLGGAPVDQISLYNGARLPGPFFRACAPIPENGPVTRLRQPAGEWLRYLAGVRFYPSQARTWMGLWPAMFWQFARSGFGYQRLDPVRISERPHAGRLYYERMFGASYAEVRAAVDALTGPRGRA